MLQPRPRPSIFIYIFLIFSAFSHEKTGTRWYTNASRKLTKPAKDTCQSQPSKGLGLGWGCCICATALPPFKLKLHVRQFYSRHRSLSDSLHSDTILINAQSICNEDLKRKSLPCMRFSDLLLEVAHRLNKVAVA
jgi:hypothetical protein